jgi:hypothetical protein
MKDCAEARVSMRLVTWNLHNDAEGSGSRHAYYAKFGARLAVACAWPHIKR